MSARVIGAAVQVAVGGRVHLVARGGVLPAGVSDETVAALVAKGLVALFDDPKPVNFDKLKVEELAALIESRNTDRADDEKIVVDDPKKANLVAALKADDEKAQAAQSGQE